MDNFRYRGDFREAVEHAKAVIRWEVETWGLSSSDVKINTLAGPVAQMERQEEFILSMIEQSKQNAACWDVLKEFGQRLDAEGKQRPISLTQWAADAFLGIRERPGKRNLGSTVGRDSALSMAVRELALRRMQKTRPGEPPECCEQGATAIDATGMAWNEYLDEIGSNETKLGYSSVRTALYEQPMQAAVQETYKWLFDNPRLKK